MRKESIISLIITFLFLGAGFTLIHYEFIGYGFSFFLFLPFVIGFVSGKNTIKKASLWGILTSLIIFIALLLIGRLEGIICVLMALPIILVSIGIGMLIRAQIISNRKKRNSNQILKGTLAPFLIFVILGFIENSYINTLPTIDSVETEVILPYSNLQVYETIKSVDTLIAEKTFLMKLDLPIPQKCILEKEEVGGLRTCYFEGGNIVEQITELEKGKILRMNVIDYQLTGRKWLGFEEAIYTFEKVSESRCKMTRITTYKSELFPRFYWRPLEHIGIQQEHEYVIRNLKNDLINKYGG